jgi:hypothetical protein
MPEVTKRQPVKAAKKIRSKGSTVGAIAHDLKISIEEARCLVWGNDYREKVRSPSGQPIVPHKKQPPTKELFCEWLLEALSRLQALPAWPIGAAEFTYFYSEACWNLTGLRILAFEDLRDLGDEAAHLAGDKLAIILFARANRDALRHPWVIDQLEAWRYAGTPAAKNSLLKFIAAYSDDGVKRAPRNVLENIQRDQHIYRDSLSPVFRNSSQRLHAALAEKYCIGENSIKDVLKKYSKAYEWWKRLKWTRLYCSGLLPRA